MSQNTRTINYVMSKYINKNLFIFKEISTTIIQWPSHHHNYIISYRLQSNNIYTEGLLTWLYLPRFYLGLYILYINPFSYRFCSYRLIHLVNRMCSYRTIHIVHRLFLQDSRQYTQIVFISSIIHTNFFYTVPYLLYTIYVHNNQNQNKIINIFFIIYSTYII